MHVCDLKHMKIENLGKVQRDTDQKRGMISQSTLQIEINKKIAKIKKISKNIKAKGKNSERYYPLLH